MKHVHIFNSYLALNLGRRLSSLGQLLPQIAA